MMLRTAALRALTLSVAGALSLMFACAGEEPIEAQKPGSTLPEGNAGRGRQDDGSAGAPEGAPDARPDPFPADPAVACPAAFKAKKLTAGLNNPFTVAGQDREVLFLLPPASFAGPRPLFVGFNGTSENGSRFATRAKLAELASKGFVVAVPSSVGNGAIWPIWDAMRAPGSEALPNKDLELFDVILACTAAHYAIDKTRIFVGGHSAGGIFTNKVLRARSSVVAGGVVGSGVFSLTSTGVSTPLDDMFVVVTWGGENDTYRGTTPNGVNVPEFNFVEQASLASQYYGAQPKVQQMHCKGNELGHAWLPFNGWLADVLIAHPKGGGKTPAASLPPSVPASCSEATFVQPPLPPVTCGASTTAGCQASCQLMADCVAENRTVGTVMKPQLSAFGFNGSSCGGCLSRCQAGGQSLANTQVLACMAQEQATAQCGPGIEGSFPFMQAVDTCCKGRADSTFCVSLCQQINGNGAASTFFPVCKQIAP
jgi:poly(3-hydroxybutyrate) depolymerase